MFSKNDEILLIIIGKKRIQGIDLLTSRITRNYREPPIGNYIKIGADNVENFNTNYEKQYFV